MNGGHQIEGNQFVLLTRGAERLEALVRLIDGAQHSLRLLYYIFADDASGRRIRDALVAAAGRGVRVRLIVDGFGSDTTGDGPFLQPLKAAGIDVCAFIPRLGRRYLLRNHQKLALADSEGDLPVALVGGFNVADDYFADFDTGGGETAWRDLGLSITGPAAAQLAGYFDALADWTHRARASMLTLRRALRKWSSPDGSVRWLQGGPMRRLSPWFRMIGSDLARARRVDLVAAYFAPTPALTRLVGRAARRGQARVVTAAKTDNLATIGAARFTFPGLLRRGVRVFEYQPCRLHTKLYVIDDLVYIGSANFDPRSLFLNLELMLRVDDAAFAATMREYVDGEVAASKERRADEFRGLATIPSRMRNAFCWFLVAVLDPGVTRRMHLSID